MATINYNEPASGTAIDFGAGTVSDACHGRRTYKVTTCHLFHCLGVER